MTERFIAPALTFLVLIAGHVAIASALLGSPASAKPVALDANAAPVIQFDTVVVTAKRS